MKIFNYGFTLILLAILTSCGGGEFSNGSSNKLELSGAITMISGELILSDGNGFSKSFTQGGVFDFSPVTYSEGDIYDVSVLKQPENQICEVNNGAGVFGQTDVSNIEVSCQQGASGLSLIGLALGVQSPFTITDGNSHEIVIDANGVFSFYPESYQTGAEFSISVVDHGVDQRCNVLEGTGVFAESDVTSPVIQCQEYIPHFSVIAEVTGLVGSIALTDGISADQIFRESQSADTQEIEIGYYPNFTEFDFSIVTTPANQTCEINNPQGQINGEDISNVSIVCEDIPIYYTLSAQVSGLYAELTLTDGQDNLLTLDANGNILLGEYLENTTYDLSITESPEGHACEVVNGQGAFVAPVSNIEINCELSGYIISGTATGIIGDVALTDSNGNVIIVSDNGDFNSYPALYDQNQSYDMLVVSSPSGQQCDIFYGAGNILDDSIYDVQLVCYAETTSLNPCGPPTTQIVGSKFSLDKQVYTFGEVLGKGGFSSFDSNQNGYPEILFGQGEGFGFPTLYTVIEYNPAADNYEILCSSQDFSSDLRRAASFSNKKYRSGSIIAYANGDVEIINHTAGQSVHIISTGLNVNDLISDDIDNDGEIEILILTEDSVQIYNGDTFQFEQAIPFGGQEFAAGYFTQSMVLELAINTGYVIAVSPTLHSVVWNYSQLEFGDRYLAAGDIDGDGLDEIVAGDQWHAIRTFNADSGGIQWDLDPGLDISALQAYDTNNDGVYEVIYADRQHGSTYVLSGLTGSKMTTIGNPSSGITDVLVGDFDNDSNQELIRGTGSNTTGPDYLVITDLTTNTTDWQTLQENNAHYALTFGDLNNDQIPDYVFASGGEDSLIQAIDGKTGIQIWAVQPSEFSAFPFVSEVFALTVGDTDSDGNSEVIVSLNEVFDGALYQLNGEDGSLVSGPLSLDDGSPVYSLKVADIDNDNNMEIIAGSGKEHTGSSGPAVYIIDGVSFSLEQTLPRLTSNFGDARSLELVDFNNDGVPEIATLADKAYILDPTVNSLVGTFSNYSSLAKLGNKLYGGTRDGVLKEIAIDGVETDIKRFCNREVHSLIAINDQDLAFTCEGRLGLYNVIDQNLEWQTNEINSLLGRFDSIAYARINGEEVLMVGGNSLYIFRRDLN